MQPVATAVMAVVDSGAVDDHVGFIRLHDRRVVTFGWDRQHHMPVDHRREIMHQSGQVIAGFEQYQAARSIEFPGSVGDGVGELAVRELLGWPRRTATRSPWPRRWSMSRLT